MMRKGLCGLVFLMYFMAVKSQQPPGGMGYLQQIVETYPLTQSSITGYTRQPAALAFAKKAGALFHCQKFSFKESPPEFLIACMIPTSSGSFLAALDYFRFAGFRQMQIGIGYGLKLTSAVAVGLKLNYYSSSASGYTTKPAFPVEVGVCYSISSVFTTGITFYNIVPFGTGEIATRLPSIITSTWSYSFSEYLTSAFQIAWTSNYGIVITPGLRLNVRDKMNFYFGYSSQLQTLKGTAGYRLKGFDLSLSVQWHPSLGMLNTVDLAWYSPSAEKK